MISPVLDELNRRKTFPHPNTITADHVTVLCNNCGHIFMMNDRGEVRDMRRDEKESMQTKCWADECRERQARIVEWMIG